MVAVHRGMDLAEAHWRAVPETIDECYKSFNVPQDTREEVAAFLIQFKPATIGSPSYRDVVFAHPDMDVTEEMRSVGVH